MNDTVAGLAVLLAGRASSWTGFRVDAIPRGALERFVAAELARGLTTQQLIDAAERSDADLVQRAASAVSVGETYFFRQAEHFELVAGELVPRLHAEGVRELRAWSAGCATGEEAYSLAATLAAAAPRDLSWSVVGTDLVERQVALARGGRYPRRALRSAAPLFPTFTSGGDDLVVREDLRRQTRFEQHNLLAGPLVAGGFHIVLCRNVLLYFEPEQARRALVHLAGSLAPGGTLLLGPMDALSPPDALSPTGPAELQAFRLRAVTPAARAGFTRWPAPPVAPRRADPEPLDPVGVHVDLLGALERGETARADALFETLERRAGAYVPGLVERALLRARTGEASAAARLMRQVLLRLEGRPDAEELAGPEPLTVGFYKETARAYLERHESRRHEPR